MRVCVGEKGTKEKCMVFTKDLISSESYDLELRSALKSPSMTVLLYKVDKSAMTLKIFDK